MGTAGLEPELPTAEQLDEASKSDSPNRQRWAKRMLEIRKAMGRLPESVPMQFTFGCLATRSVGYS